MNLTQKHIVITGASTGIGKAIAKAFMDKGAHVTVLGQHEPEFSTKYIECDVSKSEQVAQAWEKIEHCDILINNAGISIVSELEKTTEADALAMWEVNVMGVMRMFTHAFPKLKQGAAIINVSSIAGMKSFENFGFYGATKAAVTSLTKTMAVECSSKGIRANAIAPGVIATPIWQKMFGSEGDKALAECNDFVPLKRAGTPEEIAHTAVYLAENEYITGEVIVVDGGELL